MEWVETTGRTIEEAKEAALDELGVDEQDAEFEVLEEPKVGLFGRLRAEGRIRARVRPTTPRAKEDRRDRRRRTKGSGEEANATDTAPVSADLDAAEPPETKRAPRAGRSRTTAAKVGAGTAPVDLALDGGRDGGPDASTGRPRTNPTRRGVGRGATRVAAVPAGPGLVVDQAGQAGQAEVTAAGPADGKSLVEEEPSTRPRTRKRSTANRTTRSAIGAASTDDGTNATEGTLMDVALDEQGKVAEQFLVGLLDSFGLSGEIVVTVPDDDTIDIQVTGRDLGLLIGPKGATLAAIQDLTRTVVQRKTNAGNGRLFIDVAGYRQKRNEALSRFAQKIAADAVAAQTRVPMEPMSAADRKTVHDAITDLPGVATTSEGEDERRHVVVIPVSD